MRARSWLGWMTLLAGCAAAQGSPPSAAPEVVMPTLPLGTHEMPAGLRPMELGGGFFDVARSDASGPDAGVACGDGLVGPSEDCDIARMPDTVCPAGVVSCVLCIECVLVGRVAPACGNGALDDGEACDDGNRISGDGCSACAID